MNVVGGLLVLGLEAGLLWYVAPACSSAKKLVGYTLLVTCLPLLSWPWIAQRGTKARLARMEED